MKFTHIINPMLIVIVMNKIENTSARKPLSLTFMLICSVLFTNAQDANDPLFKSSAFTALNGFTRGIEGPLFRGNAVAEIVP